MSKKRTLKIWVCYMVNPIQGVYSPPMAFALSATEAQYWCEYKQQELLKQQRITGPNGMVPRAHPIPKVDFDIDSENNPMAKIIEK